MAPKPSAIVAFLAMLLLLAGASSGTPQVNPQDVKPDQYGYGPRYGYGPGYGYRPGYGYGRGYGGGYGPGYGGYGRGYGPGYGGYYGRPCCSYRRNYNCRPCYN